MRVSFLTLAVLASSIVFSGCAINRAQSLNMLDKRAEYDRPENEVSFQETKPIPATESKIPVRTRPVTAPTWIHGGETPTGDYFWGGWMSVVLENPKWTLRKREKPKGTALMDLSPPKTLKKKKKRGI